MSKKIAIITILAIATIALAAITVYILTSGQQKGIFLPKPRAEPQLSQPKPRGETLEPKREILTPREVVQRFIELDMAGARLGGEIAREALDIEQYTTINMSEPGDLLMVIKNYEILDEYPSIDEVFYYITVRFFCDKGVAFGSTGFEDEKIIRLPGGGEMWVFDCDNFFNPSADFFSIRYDPETRAEIITFTLVRGKKGEWLIDSPRCGPYISQETLQKFLSL